MHYNYQKRILVFCFVAAVTIYIVVTANFRVSSSISSDIQLKNKLEEVPVPSGTFNYGGAISFFSIFREGFADEIAKAHPQFKLKLDSSAIGTSKGISGLLSGKLSFAHSDRPLSQAEIETAKGKGLQLEAIPVAIDAIAVYVNPSTQIKSLSVASLQDIYQQKINNWQELGGANLAIVPISIEPSIDSISWYKRLNNANEFYQTYTSALQAVASTPGSIGYASAAVVAGQQSVTPISISFNNNNISIPSIKADSSANTQAFARNIYPLTRRLYIIVPHDGSIREKAAIAYTNLLLSKTGRKLIEQAGLVAIY